MAAVRRGFLLKRAATGFCGALFVALSAVFCAAGAGETILVLDASRSMWGKIGKKAKHRMVHDAFARAFERDERVLPKIGLVTYGNTSPSKCTDTSLHFGPNVADRETFLQSMKDLKPWGLTPISAALRQAARAFSGNAQSPRIVLLADGIENCGGDPCNTALELKAGLPGLTIDVIALGVSKDDHDRLSCMATMTGGAFHTAASQKELNEVGETFIDGIVAASRPAPDVLSVETSTPDIPGAALALMRSAPLPRPNPQAYLRRLVSIEPRGRPAPEDVPSADPAGEPQQFAQAPDNIAPPEMTQPDTDRVPPDMAATIDLLQTASIPDPDAPARTPAAPDRVAVLTQEPDASATPATGRKPELDIRNQEAPDRQGIKLQAKLTAEMRKIGKPLDWTVYRVEDADKALWKQVAAVRAPEPTFKLDPGTYLVRARYGYIAASKMVAVSKGKLTDATFVLNAGGLRVLSHLVFVDAPGKTSAIHYVYTGETDDNGVRQLIAKSEIQGEIIRLNAGRYRVISRLGDANSVVSTDVEVSPGVLTAVEVNHKAGVLSLEVKAGPDMTDMAATNLVVFDAEGRLVVRMHGDTASALLAPGRYTVSAEYGGRKATEDIDIRIGEAKSVTLKLR